MINTYLFNIREIYLGNKLDIKDVLYINRNVDVQFLGCHRSKYNTSNEKRKSICSFDCFIHLFSV